jgi:hypothetical protein
MIVYVDGVYLIEISRSGLNRYAVLGRSSRLWSSVVLDQAFLFALLPA